MSLEEGRIREAQAALETVRTLLLSPSVEGVDSTVPHLERALERLDAVRNALQAGSREPAAAAGLLALRKAARRVTVLLENAAGFHLGWAQQFALVLGGYTAQGEPVRPNSRGSLSLEG